MTLSTHKHIYIFISVSGIFSACFGFIVIIENLNIGVSDWKVSSDMMKLLLCGILWEWRFLQLEGGKPLEGLTRVHAKFRR